MLTGTELLKTVKNNPSPKSHLVRICGYTVITPAGQTKLLYKKFYEALLEAKGIHLPKPQTKSPKPLSHLVSIHKTGIICIGSAYTSHLPPGTKVSIKLHKNSISLVPVLN